MPPRPSHPAAAACPHGCAAPCAHVGATTPDSGRRLSLLVHLNCTLAGVVTTLLGPLLPALLARWRLGDAQAGALFAAEFAASLAGVAVSGRLLPRLGYVPTIAAGVALTALGVALLPAGGYSVGLAAVLVFGFGLGLSGPGYSLWVAERGAQRRAAALSVLNMVWALGAALAPAIVAVFLRHGRLTWFLPGLALVLALTAAALPAARAAWGDPVAAAAPGRAPVAPGSVWLTAPAPAFAAFFFVYVGVEQALSGWAATLAQRFGGGSAGSVALVPSFFWAGLVVGRGAVPLLLRRFEEATLAFASLGVAAAGSATLLVARRPEVVALGVSLAGLGLAPQFPMAVALLTQRFGVLAARVAGPLFAMGSLGGALLPWLVGVISSHGGGLRAGLALTLAGIVGLSLLYARVSRTLPVAPACG